MWLQVLPQTLLRVLGDIWNMLHASFCGQTLKPGAFELKCPRGFREGLWAGGPDSQAGVLPPGLLMGLGTWVFPAALCAWTVVPHLSDIQRKAWLTAEWCPWGNRETIVPQSPVIVSSRASQVPTEPSSQIGQALSRECEFSVD